MKISGDGYSEYSISGLTRRDMVYLLKMIDGSDLECRREFNDLKSLIKKTLDSNGQG